MERGTILNGKPQANSIGVVASDGAIIFPDDLAQAFSYNGDGTLNYIQVVAPATPGTAYAGGTYRQTFSYTSGVVNNISNWVLQ